ncbi:restriction endonuclease subunit S [Phocaeicola vulgatus]|uniref:restriction endonuclease subunit S n=1 Tax=Phocaeicola vulgatus TaxID=821 RepID=UPI00356A0C58
MSDVPHLRFPEFSGEWKKVRLGDNCNIQMCKRIMAAQTNTDRGVPFFKIGTIGGKADAYISKELFDEYKAKYPFPHKGEVMITCAGTVGKCIIYNGKDSYYQDSNIVWIDNPNEIISNDFLYHLLCKVNWSHLNSTTIVRIYNDDLRNLKLYIPQHDEQKKITHLLSLINERIATQNKIIEDLKLLKSAIRKKVFVSLKEEHTESLEINQLLTYEQPTAYIVTNDEYSTDTTLIPVLTANKGFVLGYTDEDFSIYQKGECIIFDDFTMDAKYVSFPFKVKSSAIKILTAKPNVNLRFMFEYLSYLELKSEEHKRHYISEIASLVVELPSKEMQNKIASLMASLDNKLALEENTKVKYEDEKQYQLSQMFI